MRRFTLPFLSLALALLATGSVHAQEAAETLDAKVNAAFAAATGPYVGFIFAPFPGTDFAWIVGWLVVAATVFTLYFAFVQFRLFGHAISLVKGDYSDPEDAGEVSHFQALTTALSRHRRSGQHRRCGRGDRHRWPRCHVLDDPVRPVWGMASKFTECTLGVKYRNEYPDGTVSGGPMYYLSKGFKERGIPGGGILAILCLDLLHLRRAGRRQHVPGQPGARADRRP